MRPILALELSPEGITLHELSYDSKWRQLCYAALNDPFLPKKMAAMRGVARASQGRFFKSQLWLPADQIHTLSAEIHSEEPEDRLTEASAHLRDLPEYANKAYSVTVSENDVFGKATLVFVEKTVLGDAKRFAKGYGFGIEDVTSARRIGGFREQPYFADNVAAPVKVPVSVDMRKVGFFGMLAVVLAGVGAGGYWLYNNVDFSDDPSAAIKATENRILDATEDPRAPIRPSALNSVASAPAPGDIDGGETLATLPTVEPLAGVFDTQVGQTVMGSDLARGTPPVPATVQAGPAISQISPATLSSSSPGSLPAPETSGFPLVAAVLPQVVDAVDATGFSGQRISRYAPVQTPGEFAITPRRTDVLPREQSTVALAAQLGKYNDSMGLTQVEANNAAALRQVLALEAQKIPPVIVSGRPDILPVLRGGNALPQRLPESVTPDVQPPLAPVLDAAAIAALQNLPPEVVTGLPELTPVLRSGQNVAELPPDPAPEPAVEEPTVEEPAQETPPEVSLSPEEEAARISALQATPPVVLNQRPDWALSLRDGVEIPQSTTPAPEVPEEPLSDAARLHPLARPDSIIVTAVLNDPDLSEAAVPSSNAPVHRAPDFATKVEKMMAAFAESLRTTPRFTDAPREVNLPTRANVAREATIENGINLREFSLIGVYGKPSAYHALIRSGRGKYTTVKVGDTYDRWKVIAIGESTVRLQKGNKTKVLRLPG